MRSLPSLLMAALVLRRHNHQQPDWTFEGTHRATGPTARDSIKGLPAWTLADWSL